MALVRLLILLAFLFLFDLYTYRAVKTATRNRVWVKKAYWVFHGSLYVLMLLLSFKAIENMVPRPIRFDFNSIVTAVYVPKLLVMGILFLEDITRLVRWVWKSYISKKQPTETGGTGVRISRAQFISQSALLLASVPMAGMLYAILRGKYQYQVRRVVLEFAHLPEAFHGMTIAQISDIHAGTFDNKAAVKKGVDMLMEQKPDAIFFTGDLVNSEVDEMHGFEEIFSSLKAKDGVYSIFGNHDYGGFDRRLDEQEKIDHVEKMKAMHKTLGWDLMLNENRILERNGEKIAIIGVENWSAHPYFPKHGRMDLAVAGTEEVPFKLLLSHDPSHWDAMIRPEYPDIAATFSGHTHGFQLGVEIPGFRFSPSQWEYKQWGGLYTEGNQHLYVNRGFGCLQVFSGRAGIWPEITIFELRKTS